MQGNIDLDYSRGCLLALQDWAWLNRHGAFENEILRKYVAPFPPRGLMFVVSRLTREKDFAAHGVDFYQVLSEISKKPLTEYQSILDFGCGCGRLLRMLLGHPGRISACDVDPRLISWVIRRLPFVNAVLTDIQPPLPYPNATFDCIISISNFTHFSWRGQDAFLEELNRISMPEGSLFITVHGRKALRRFMEQKDKKSILGQMIDTFNRGEHPKSTANSTDIAVLAVEGVIFKRNRAAGSICAAVELLRVDPCRFSGAPVRSSV